MNEQTLHVSGAMSWKFGTAFETRPFDQASTPRAMSAFEARGVLTCRGAPRAFRPSKHTLSRQLVNEQTLHVSGAMSWKFGTAFETRPLVF